MSHYILNRRADEHHIHCEDAYFYTQVDEWVIAAVFDGCSDGINSHFASQLYAYSLRSMVNTGWHGLVQAYNKDNGDLTELCNNLAGLVGTQAMLISDGLGLTQLETLSTVVLALYNTQERELIVKFLGDGACSVDSQMFRVDSGAENAPKYLAYLNEDELNPELLQDIYEEKYFRDVKRWSIMTDGIDAIRHPHKPLEECINYLLEDNKLLPSNAMLSRKANVLQKEGARLLDDLTIIRYEAV